MLVRQSATVPRRVGVDGAGLQCSGSWIMVEGAWRVEGWPTRIEKKDETWFGEVVVEGTRFSDVTRFR